MSIYYTGLVAVAIFYIMCKETEYDKMKKDIRKYGNVQSGMYKNIKWLMKRPYNTYWCGYVEYDNKLLQEDDYNTLDELSHIGFNCTHYGDYNPILSLSNPGKYRDYEYVLGKLKDMIDLIDTIKIRHKLTMEMLNRIFINDITIIIDNYL